MTRTDEPCPVCWNHGGYSDGCNADGAFGVPVPPGSYVVGSAPLPHLAPHELSQAMRQAQAAADSPRSEGGSTLPGAMTPEFVHAREVAVALERWRGGDAPADIERDYGFPGGMLAALSQPREPTPSPAAPRDYDEVPCVWCLRPGREHLGDHSDCPSPGGTATRYTAQPPAAPRDERDAEWYRKWDLCPEHAIRLPCPACATREDGK